MKPVIQEISFTYKKKNAGVWVLNTKDIPVDQTKINNVQLVYLAPRQVGGNHKHQRTEWFVGIGDLQFIWLDAQGAQHSEPMNPDGQLRLITVPPFLPHAVANISADVAGVLYEMADGELQEVEEVGVLCATA
jgi:uncharacterized RmlC-like cupin family protein